MTGVDGFDTPPVPGLISQKLRVGMRLGDPGKRCKAERLTFSFSEHTNTLVHLHPSFSFLLYTSFPGQPGPRGKKAA